MPIERLKFLSRDILYYGMGNMLYTVAQLIAMPLIIKNMSMGEVANWNLLLPTGVLLSAIVMFGMDSAIVRFVIDKDDFQKKAIFSTGFYFVMGLSLVMGLFLWMFSAQIMAIINFSVSYKTSYLILLCWLPGIILSQFFQNWLKYTFQRHRFIAVIALQATIYLVAIICLKLANKTGLQNVMLASLVSVWIPALLGLYYSCKMLALKLDKDILIKLLVYGSPFMIMSFGYNLMFSFDKYVLSGSVSRAQFAVYSQAFRIAAIFSMIVSSFNFAFGPLSLSLLNKEDAPPVFASLRTYYLLFMCLVGVVFMAVSRAVILLLAGQNYIDGDKFFPFFVLGYIFYGLYSFAQLGIISSKKSYLGLFVLSASLIITIILDILLVRQIKGYGTAIGFLLGNLTMVLVADRSSGKYLKVSYDSLKDIVIIMIFVVCGITSPFLFAVENLYLDGLIKLTINMALFCAIIMLPIFRLERNLIRHVLSDLTSGRRLSRSEA